MGSTVNAAGNLSVVATGAGADSNINVVGSQLTAGGNAHIEAEGDIVLQAAKNTAQQESDNSSSGWSVGVGFTVGGTANGFTIDLAANKARGSADGSDVSWSNSAIQAGNRVDLISGGDTTLKGAVVSGERVVADIGGDLNIESLQDTSTYESEQKSMGVGVSLCLPPICVGASSVSASYNQQKIDSNYASVSEQSGIKAGDGGFDIRVEGNTDLKGAVIASNQAAVDAGLNTLDTGTLTHSDIRNYAEYDASSLSLSGSYSTGYNGAEDTDADNSPWGKPPSSEAGFSAGTPIALSAGDSDRSTTHSGISGGALIIRDTDRQQQLTGKTAEQAVADLERDVTSEQDGSNTLKPIFDLEEIETAFAITEAFVQESGAFLQRKSAETANAKKELDKELAKPEGERDLGRIAQLESIQDDNATWGMGGAGRLLLTALGAGASGNVTGGTGEMLQATAANFAQGLAAQGVKQAAGDDDTTRALLHAAVGCLGAAGQGGDCGSGALGASGAVALNLLLDEMQGVNGSELTATEKEARSNLVASLLAGAAAASGGDAGAVGTAGRLETENNHILAFQYLLQHLATRIAPLLPSGQTLVNTAGIGAVAYTMGQHGESVYSDPDVPLIPHFDNMAAADSVSGIYKNPIQELELGNEPYPAEDQQKPEPIGGGYAVGGKPDVPSHTGGSPIVENGAIVLDTPVAEQLSGIMLAEIQLPSAESFEQARNRALEIIGDLGAGSKPLVGRLPSSVGEGQVIGRTSADGKVRWRLDYDPDKGAHINIEDFRSGKGESAKKYYIQFDGNEQTFKNYLKHLNR